MIDILLQQILDTITGNLPVINQLLDDIVDLSTPEG